MEEYCVQYTYVGVSARHAPYEMLRSCPTFHDLFQAGAICGNLECVFGRLSRIHDVQDKVDRGALVLQGGGSGRFDDWCVGFKRCRTVLLEQRQNRYQTISRKVADARNICRVFNNNLQEPKQIF